MKKSKKKFERRSHLDTKQEQIDKDTNKSRSVKRIEGGKKERVIK